MYINTYIPEADAPHFTANDFDCVVLADHRGEIGELAMDKFNLLRRASSAAPRVPATRTRLVITVSQPDDPAAVI